MWKPNWIEKFFYRLTARFRKHNAFHIQNQAYLQEENRMDVQMPCYENRELSWLRFNERVLEEAEDFHQPLCERMSFLSIFQSNLDEFIMVRVGSLHDEMLLDETSRENKTEMTPAEQISAVMDRTHALAIRRDAAYSGILERLQDYGIQLLNFGQINEDGRTRLEELFRQEYLPLLSFFIVGKQQTFPFLRNKDIYAVAVLNAKPEKKQRVGIVPCGGNIFPRLVPVPDRPGSYVLSEELILHFLPILFPKYRISSKSLARITRNADIDTDSAYDEGRDYRDAMSALLKRRKKLNSVRLELSRKIDDGVIKQLCKHLSLNYEQVFESATPLDYSFFSIIQDHLRNHRELFFDPQHPQPSADLDDRKPILSQICERDRMLHYPYETMRPFLQMLREAANDPSVVSIKMTLYRLASHSKVVDGLVEAAENGKQVDVLVELKARFDEENNIEWSRQLEQAGCHVIYGVDGLKVHSKLCLITCKTEDGIRYITQIGTGNYNEMTSRLYTDLSLITASHEIGEDAAEIFRALSLNETVQEMKWLLVAPEYLQDPLLHMIDDEIQAVRQGLDGYLAVKINSLTNKILMDKLIEASQAGVQIDLIVRGICCLHSGIPGITDNIHVISVVGRYLEHSRIYVFGREDRARYYISSADWMTRSTLRRVEVAAPVLDPTLKKRLQHIIDTMLNDNTNARVQQPDGHYQRRIPSDSTQNCQQQLYQEACENTPTGK